MLRNCCFARNAVCIANPRPSTLRSSPICTRQVTRQHDSHEDVPPVAEPTQSSGGAPDGSESPSASSHAQVVRGMVAAPHLFSGKTDATGALQGVAMKEGASLDEKADTRFKKVMRGATSPPATAVDAPAPFRPRALEGVEDQPGTLPNCGSLSPAKFRLDQWCRAAAGGGVRSHAQQRTAMAAAAIAAKREVTLARLLWRMDRDTGDKKGRLDSSATNCHLYQRRFESCNNRHFPAYVAPSRRTRNRMRHHDVSARTAGRAAERGGRHQENGRRESPQEI